MTKEEQKKADMDMLFSGLTSTSQEIKKKPVEEKKKTSEPEPKTLSGYDQENIRVCTIMKVLTMNKLRHIAKKENIDIRELFEIGANQVINIYERKYGEIHVPSKRMEKGDVRKIFGK